MLIGARGCLTDTKQMNSSLCRRLALRFWRASFRREDPRACHESVDATCRISRYSEMADQDSTSKVIDMRMYLQSCVLSAYLSNVLRVLAGDEDLFIKSCKTAAHFRQACSELCDLTLFQSSSTALGSRAWVHRCARHDVLMSIECSWMGLSCKENTCPT